MKRKIIKQGHNTLTVTLPAKWVEKKGMKAGDEVDISERDGSLLIGGQVDSSKKEISVDISGLDRTTILILLQGLYRYGYDTIEITSKDSSVIHHRISGKKNLSEIIYDIANRFVGSEVISASKNRYVIKRIAEESIDDFPAVLRRVFLLLNEMMENLIAGLRNKDMEVLQAIEFQHSNLKKFINFCLRLLNKYGYGSQGKTAFYFNTISLLSKTEDIIKNHSRYVIRHKIVANSSGFFTLLSEIQQSLRRFYEIFYDYDLSKVAELNKHRDKFRSELFSYGKELSKGENILIGGLSQVVELILDMTETRMALED